MENENDKINGEVINGTTNQNDRKAAKIIHQRRLFEGPIPPPDVLLQYDQINPGLADRIVRMAEAQSEHRRSLESNHLAAQIQHAERADFEARLGQIFAFIIAMTAIIGGIASIIAGYPTAGSFITLLGLGGIVASFIQGRFSKTPKKQPNKPSGTDE